MKRIKIFVAMIILAGLLLPASALDHKPITQELMDLVRENPEIGSMLKTSIAEAKKINPDPKTNPVQSLSGYYDFIDSASQLIPQAVLNPKDLTREQILQSLCYFY
jgi:hypothetical protein